ncbi:MAG: VWA domain-containing protein [Hyphomicrobiales bacterium]|nr:VWA domain-containing protein [Hyphomicrobiales bacterium]
MRGSFRTESLCRIAGAALLAVTLTAATAAHADGNKAIIVLDASGSMWGQIEGEAKIVIARRVLADVLSGIKGDVSLGLLAYGHREKGNCSDIEMLVPPAAGTAAAIAGAADKLNPKGKTPITKAVRQAAEGLNYTEDKATVILITDGLETCSADPCALGNELEKGGVDFTAHVVGFGLSAEEGRQVACLAEETGGLYIPAEDAAALGDALTDTVEEIAAAEPEPAAQPEPEPETLPTATLSAPETVEIGKRFVVEWTGPGGRHDRIHMFDPRLANGEGRDVASKRLVNEDFDNKKVTLIAPVRPGQYELRYLYGKKRPIIATATIEVVEAPVSLSAPANVEIGRRFTVEWVGPGARKDAIEIYSADARQGEGKVLRSLRLVNGDFDNRKVTMEAPADPGFYQLRYWNGDSREVLATRQIEVLDAEVSIAAPDKVSIGRTFTVEWIGPGGRRDAIEIFDEAADAGRGKVFVTKRLVNGDFDNRKVDLIAPTRPGTYQLRYWNGENRKVLATRPLEIEDAVVSLTAPEATKILHTVKIGWVGPGAYRDQIEFFDPQARAGKGQVLRAKRLVNGDMDNRMVDLVAPSRPGTYELRYWSGDGSKALAVREITIEAMPVAVNGPKSASTASSITVTWEGPGAYRDTIQIFDPAAKGGKGAVLTSQRVVNGDYDNRTVTIKTPKTPGNYRLQYWNGDDNVALAEAPIILE